MAHSTDYDPGGSVVTGRRVLLIVLAFFGVIIAANMTMLYFAVNNFAGLVVKNSYVASQSFEEDRARLQASALSHWRIAVATEAGSLELTISDEEGAPVSGAGLSGVVGRRSHDREDQAVAFVETSPGVYRAEAALARGAWRLTLEHDESKGVARKVDFDRRAPVGDRS